MLRRNLSIKPWNELQYFSHKAWSSLTREIAKQFNKNIVFIARVKMVILSSTYTKSYLVVASLATCYSRGFCLITRANLNRYSATRATKLIRNISSGAVCVILHDRNLSVPLLKKSHVMGLNKSNALRKKNKLKICTVLLQRFGFKRIFSEN